ANTDHALPVEFRRLGDPSLTEAYAFLLEGLLLEPGFVRRLLGVSRVRDVLRFIALHKLYLVRRYAAKLLYERRWHDGGPTPRMAEAYRELLYRATKAEFPQELYLYDSDPAFYVARYLRAWIFEAQLKEHLYERFDDEWYRNDRTGPFLLDLWRQGFTHSPEHLSAKLGISPLEVDPLIRSITRHLN
ncbi:MAG: peptidase M3, partial [Candidatus Methylomirabilaceae bacterium]